MIRWLHIYVSLLAFAALVFFGLTGITLNHPAWFGADATHVAQHRGQMRPEWLGIRGAEGAAVDEQNSDDEQQDAPPGDEATIARLEVVEHLRGAHGARGAVSEFRVDDYEVLVLFRGPAYAADAVIDRETGDYTMTVTTMGVVALLNDLHKGRDTGLGWSVTIDVVSAATVFVSLTGLGLVFFIRRKRVTGLLSAVAGTIALIAIIIWLVP